MDSIYDIYGWFYDPVGWAAAKPDPCASKGADNDASKKGQSCPMSDGKTYPCTAIPCVDGNGKNLNQCIDHCGWSLGYAECLWSNSCGHPSDPLGDIATAACPAGGPASRECTHPQWVSCGGAWNAKNPCRTPAPFPQDPGNPSGTIPGGVKEAGDATKSTLDAITKFFQPCNLGGTPGHPAFTLPGGIPCWFGGLLLVMVLLVFIRH